MNRRGFTFIELAIVAVIVAILCAIAVPNFREAQTRACVSRAHADLAAVTLALESYRHDARAYPPNAAARTPSDIDLLRLTTPIAYISSLPVYEQANQTSRVEYRPFYLNLAQFHTEEAPFVVPYRGGIALVSTSFPGPDYKSNLDATTDPVKYEIYDPTNGTISVGDIVSFAP